MKPPREADADAFLRAVLAPLPKGEKAVRSRDFLKEIEEDEGAFWEKGSQRAGALDNALLALRSLAALLKELGCPLPGLAEGDDQLSRQLFLAMDRLMKRPSADMSCVEFKRRHVRWCGGFPGWAEALAADEARVRPGGRLRRLVEPSKATEARP